MVRWEPSTPTSDQSFHHHIILPSRKFYSLVDSAMEFEFLDAGHWEDVRLRSLRLLTDYLASAGQAGEGHEALQAFVKKLRPGDVVITFNWDNLIERALYLLGTEVSFTADPAKITVLKLHGSINWFEPPSGTAAKTPELVETLTEGILRTKDYRYYDVWTGLNRPPLILPPVAWKRIRSTPFFGALWTMAVRALVRARQVAFIGYSIPRDDLQARALLTTGWGARRIGSMVQDQPTLEYTLVDPEPSICGRYASLLQPTVRYIQAEFSADCIPLLFHEDAVEAS